MATQTSVLSFVTTLVSLRAFPVFVVYLLVVFLSGVWRRSTRPVSESVVKPVLLIYNVSCTLLSVYSLWTFGVGYASPDLASVFQRENTPQFTLAFRVYCFAKWFELLDTVFMIIRHKNRQITVLHVYHHSSMLLFGEVAYQVYPWPALAFFFFMNSFVHVVLYLWYTLAALNPSNPPQWKKQLTQLQIIQFLVGFVYAAYGYQHHGFCLYGPIYGISLTTLFCNFYYQAYIKKRNSKKE